MKNIFTSVVILLLQRIPLINKIPAVRDAGTIEAALRVVTKAFQNLTHVGVRSAVNSARISDAITGLKAARAAEIETGERASRVANKLSELLK